MNILNQARAVVNDYIRRNHLPTPPSNRLWCRNIHEAYGHTLAAFQIASRMFEYVHSVELKAKGSMGYRIDVSITGDRWHPYFEAVI